MKYFLILIALLALSFACWGQSDRVKTVETRDSASLVIFDNSDNDYTGENVQEVLEELLTNDSILYVGVGGNDNTAVKGSRVKYWATIDSALQYAREGELLYHFSVDTQLITVTGVEPVSIISRGVVENTTGSNIFSFTTLKKPIYISLNTYIGKPLSTQTSTADSVITHVYCMQCQDYPMYAPGRLNYMQVDNMENPTESNFTRTSDGRITNIKIGNFTAPDSIPAANAMIFVGVGGSGSGSQGWATTNLEIDNIYAVSPNGQKGILFGTFGSASNDTETRNNTQINNLYYQINSYQPDINPVFNYFGTGIASPYSIGDIQPENEGYNELKIFNVLSDAPLEIGGNLDKVSLQGRFPRTRAIQATTTGNDLNVPCQINLDVVCDSSHVASFLEKTSTGKIHLSGRLETRSDTFGVIYTDNIDTLFLENIQLIRKGSGPCIIAVDQLVVIARGDFFMSTDSLQSNITLHRLDYGYTNPTNTLYQSTQTILDSLFTAIPKHSATLYQSTLSQYTFPTPSTVDTITIDTLSNALMTDGITQDTGYIRNISADTMRWQVSYNFFRDSDEDALTSFIDLTTDGTDSPEAIPGSEAYSEQAVANGTQHAGPTFTVDVPPGNAIRLCVYGSSVAAGVDISDLTIALKEIYRE